MVKITNIIDIPSTNSHIATARDERNKEHIFCITDDGQVFKRKGRSKWEELTGERAKRVIYTTYEEFCSSGEKRHSVEGYVGVPLFMAAK